MTPSADEQRKIAEKGAATIRNVMDKGEEVADRQGALARKTI